MSRGSFFAVIGLLVLTWSACSGQRQLTNAASEESANQTKCTFILQFSDASCFPMDQDLTDSIRIDNVKIYSRWGEKVFETTNNQKWICKDGSVQPDLPSGTYFYIMKYSKLGVVEPQTLEGNIELICN